MNAQGKRRVRKARRTHFQWLWLVIPLLIGLVVGWLAIGWGAWPVSYRNAAASSLRAAEREEYLMMVAESFAIDGDIASARNKLESWSHDGLVEDVKRLQTRLWTEDALEAGEVQELVYALGVEAEPSAAATKQAGPVDFNKTDNILVLGRDNPGKPGTWRTDTIMVVAIDYKTNQIGIVSIPRDLYLDIPGWGMDRINAAHYVGEMTGYPGGGSALARHVVEEAVGIPTQHYVLIKREGLATLVDALGGVTVTLDCPVYEAESDRHSPTGLRYLTLPAGDVFLDGPTAEQFITYRYVESDFGRLRRQQQLIWAIRNRALQANILPRIPELWQALSDMFTTDLSLPNVIKLARVGTHLKPQNVHSLVLDRNLVEGFETADGWQVLRIKDKAALQAELAQLFSSKPLSDLGKRESSECPPSPFENQGQ